MNDFCANCGDPNPCLTLYELANQLPNLQKIICGSKKAHCIREKIIGEMERTVRKALSYLHERSVNYAVSLLGYERYTDWIHDVIPDFMYSPEREDYDCDQFKNVIEMVLEELERCEVSDSSEFEC
jgi:hypothetical protein